MRLALTLGSISATALAIAFVQQWFVLVAIGPGVETDAFFAGMAIPQLILAVVSGSLVHVLVPLLSGEERSKAKNDVWTLILCISAFFAAVALLLISLAPLWAPRLFPGFSSAGTSLLLVLVRVQLLGMIGTATAGVLIAWCHSQRYFVRAEVLQLVASLSALAVLVWALPRFGIVAAAWISVARAVLLVLLLLPSLGLTKRIVWSTHGLREGWRRIRPLLFGTVYYKTDPVVDRYLASMAPPGELSLLHLAQQMFGAATQIVQTGLAAPVVPVLAADAKHGQWESFRSSVRRRVVVIVSVTLLAYLGILLIGRPVLSLVIGHGGVTQGNVYFLWILLLSMGGVLVAGSAGSVTSGAFYAKGDTRTPTLLSVVTYTLYMPLKVVAYLKWGVVALGIATSVFAIVNFAVQFLLLERVVGKSVVLREKE